MKRVIKFRVWDKAKHRMLGVDQLAFGPNGELVSIYSDGPDFSNDSDALMGEKPDLNDAELMQFTGLHDKNGRDIYEGDIVYAYNEEFENTIQGTTYRDTEVTDVVVFKDGCFVLGDKCQINLTYPPFLEVIGNVYENPELLEAEIQ